MIRIVLGFAAGLLFGVGLVVAGMTNPAKVLNFLDLAGTWDPSLAFVMAGAVATTFVGYRLAFRRTRPVTAERFEVPTRRDVDLPLLGGAVVFGIGWGIGGYCPGPAWSAALMAAPGTLVFIPAMLLGMWFAGVIPRMIHGQRAGAGSSRTTTTQRQEEASS